MTQITNMLYFYTSDGYATRAAKPETKGDE